MSFSGIEVRYGTFALGPIHLDLPSGQIACLLGPNGSGKTTLIRSVLGLQRTHGGSATWAGRQIAGRSPDVLARIGYVSDSPDDLIAELTPREYWEFCAVAYARKRGDVATMLERADELATRLDFSPPRRSIAGFSLGMRRKTQLVAALIHEPELLVLDEPLIGLDFLSVRALEALLSQERARGILIWMASHDFGLASRLADRASVLHLGRLILDLQVDGAGASLEERVEEAIRLARKTAVR